MTRLSVNIDHVATLRQARGVAYPDPVDAARAAEIAGAAGITVHLRSDRRHIQDHDLERLKGLVPGKLNLEMSTTDEMVSIALEAKPDQVTLVPERPEEITTEGGLDLSQTGDAVRRAGRCLHDRGIPVSLFLDPDLHQIDAIGGLECPGIEGFEINTDAYTKTASDHELGRIATCAARGAELGLRVYAGHGLTTANVGAIAAMPEIEELNIGHSIVSRAVLVGMETAVKEMLAAIRGGKVLGS